MSLAEDLVTAAARAMQGAAYGPATKRKAQLAVAAVLKRLAAKPDGFLRHQEDGGITYTRTLRELADEIEGASRG